MNLTFSIFLKGGGARPPHPFSLARGGLNFQRGGPPPLGGGAVQNHASEERAGERKSNLEHDQIIVSEIVSISI